MKTTDRKTPTRAAIRLSLQSVTRTIKYAGKRVTHQLYGLVSMIMCAVIVFNGTSVYALTQDQINVFNQGIGFFNTEVCGSSATTLVGNDNLQKIFNYFVHNGFTPEQAAGMIGNVIVESRGDPQIYEGDGKDHDFPPSTTAMLGWGIVQWTPPSKITTYAQTAGEQPKLLETQVEFLLKQLNGTAPNSSEKTAGDKLRQVTTGITVNGQEMSTAWHAAQVFLMYYERAKDSAPDGNNAFNRGNLANQALALYGSSSQAGSDSGNSQATTSSSCGGISAHCDSPLTSGSYDTIKSALMDKFKIDLRGDQNAPWAIETYNTICTLSKAPAFYSKLTAAGPITVSLHTENECGGGHAGDNNRDKYHDPYGIAMTGYCAGSKDYNRYLLTHELGHMYDFRNSDIKQAWANQVWGHSQVLPTYNCQHDYDHIGLKGPYEDECWADMIGEYLVWFDLRATVGGVPAGTNDFKQYETQYPAYYNFARDHIFGGVAYTSF